MVNPEKGELEITLGGKVLVLKFDNNAVASLEPVLGYGFAHLLMNFQKLIGIGMLSNCIAAGLAHDPANRKWTAAKVLTHLEGARFEEYATLLIRGLLLWKGLDPDVEPETESPGAEEPPPTGPN